MATSIRDLIRALEGEASYAAGDEGQSGDASGALAELGRTLRRLASDGLELHVNGLRENIARDLAESCSQIAATVHVDGDGRLTTLAGGLAAAVGALRDETGRDQRWAITVEVARAVRVLTTYAAEGESGRSADLVWTHLTARALVTHALQDTPSVQSYAVLDRAVPSAMMPRDMPASRAALESLTAISAQLRRSSAELIPRPTLLEVFAVTRAAESVTRYATAAAATLAGTAIPDARPAAAIWYEVRDRLQPFTTAAPFQLEDRDLGVWAQRTHSELRREFGPANQPQLMQPDGSRKGDAVRHLHAMVNEIPSIADHLASALWQLADHGELHALATRLPYRHIHLEPRLAHRAVVADRFDIVRATDRLGDAAKLAAELATTLHQVGGPSIVTSQPGLAAANADRPATRPNPYAALVQEMRNGLDKVGAHAATEATTPGDLRAYDTTANCEADRQAAFQREYE